MDKLNIIRQKANYLRIPGEIYVSDRPNKKYYLLLDGEKIYFGASGYEDFLDHGDVFRRELYRKRHGAIFTKNGIRAIDIKYSPAYLSYYLLW